MAEQILIKCNHNHDAVLTFDEFIPWFITPIRDMLACMLLSLSLHMLPPVPLKSILIISIPFQPTLRMEW